MLKDGQVFSANKRLQATRKSGAVAFSGRLSRTVRQEIVRKDDRSHEFR